MTDTVATVLASSYVLAILPALGVGLYISERKTLGSPEVRGATAGLLAFLLGPVTLACGVVWAVWFTVGTVRGLTARPAPADLPPVTNGSYRGCTCVVAHDGPCAGPGRVRP